MSETQALKELEEAARHNLDMDLFDEMRTLFYENRTEDLTKRFCHKCGQKTLVVHSTLSARNDYSCTASFSLRCETCDWKQNWFGGLNDLLDEGGVYVTPCRLLSESGAAKIIAAQTERMSRWTSEPRSIAHDEDFLF
ncbi:MAG: NOB1 family endonuclease [Proteobacteria bacterium]|nr:NOB1 family endonuclease [Pseudomonadota bacterium]MBU4447474.1 NOB1 family endonuclease [Pseudomonadota bacterium]